MPHTKLSVRVAVSGFAVSELNAILCLPFRNKRDQTSRLSALLRNVKSCSEDLRVGPAAAQIAADSILHVVKLRVWIAIHQRRTPHHHPPRPQPAFHPSTLHHP